MSPSSKPNLGAKVKERSKGPRIARWPDKGSTNFWPVASSNNKAADRFAMPNPFDLFVSGKIPITISAAPSATGVSKSEADAAESPKSASINKYVSGAPEAATPAATAPPFPIFDFSAMTLAPALDALSPVPSTDPSSTTSTSPTSPVSSNADTVAATKSTLSLAGTIATACVIWGTGFLRSVAHRNDQHRANYPAPPVSPPDQAKHQRNRKLPKLSTNSNRFESCRQHDPIAD